MSLGSFGFPTATEFQPIRRPADKESHRFTTSCEGGRLRGILKGWKLPELEGRDLDDPATTVLKKTVVRRKRFLNELYRDFYQQMLAAMAPAPQGKIVEVGSGPGFLKEIEPSVIASEVFPCPDINLVLSAVNLPFKPGTVSCFLMIDVFHHLKKPIEFLRQAEQCLVRGGRVIMIEPYNTPVGGFIYRHFHHEAFDPMGGWEIHDGGPLSGSNTALPWIIFVRDHDQYKRTCPDLVLRSVHLHTPFAYILSGGVSYRSFVPGLLFRPVRFIEKMLSPVMNRMAMFATITLEKTG